ncbi:MAG: GNAT family N-acetyltransferase [Parvibaculum sp.]|nr:GNAT family N-acetyltransferase [Parvibaculum sp.]
MEILPFENLAPTLHAEAARILRDALAHMPSAYGKPGEAEAEVADVLGNPERQALAAVEDGRLLGWIGWIDEMYSHSWELHPLAVDEPHRRKGVARRLVAALEARARDAGILTLWLGTDDDYGGTNLHGKHLFPNVLDHAARIEQKDPRHPIAFYRSAGFEVAGLLPDANGPGKPDILMVKRVGG